MKTVLILRHAKAGMPTAKLGAADHERPLDERGLGDAPRMGRLLRQEGLVPDWVVSSSAVRARETARLAMEACDYAKEMEVTEALYHAPPAKIAALLSELPDEVERVLVVGHNPGLEEWVYEVTGSDKTMPTAALAEVGLEIDSWAEFGTGVRGTLNSFWLPRDLED